MFEFELKRLYICSPKIQRGWVQVIFKGTN